MQLQDNFNRPRKNNAIRMHYRELIATQGKFRQREIAEKLNVSEAELIEQQLGVQSIRLLPDFNHLIEDLPNLGYIMNLTRNDFAVHERKGVYQNIKIRGTMGLIIADDKKIDLRLFLSQWFCAYAVREDTAQGERYSLQFFDQSGTAIQKIFLQADSSFSHYEYLLKTYRDHDEQRSTEFLPKTSPQQYESTDNIDVNLLRKDWQAMTDVHQFIHILRRHNIDRQQAFHLVGSDYAQAFNHKELQRVLTEAASSQLPIMCFVGNQGSIQIFSGTIHHIKTLGPWLNVLDPEFNLHLLETGIDCAWLVRKPTADGLVTSLEFYDAQGNQVVQFFGKRQEGSKENPAWTQLAESVLLSQALKVSG